MIPRYAREQMVSIWSPETKFRIWFEIEAHATDALAELGVVPKEAAAKVWEKGKNAKFDVARIDEIEREVKHDVIAFLTHLSEIVGPVLYPHQGMTSSDVLDTCLNVQLMRAAALLIADTDELLAALKKRAFEYKATPPSGRSHGIHATFGVKLATYFAEFTRARQRLVTARAEISTCAISGAVGTFANIDPRIEEHVAKAMGLSAIRPISTQVIPRDRHAACSRPWAWWRHLWSAWRSRSAICNAPKCWKRRNISPPVKKAPPPCHTSAIPVLTENVTGLARMVRAYVLPAMENVALWHERDISTLQSERYIGPDATITLDFALARMTGVVQKLVVYPNRMQENLERTHGLVHSQRVMLALTQAGVSREDSYRLVQRNAMRAWNGDGNLLDLLKADPDVAKALPVSQLEAMFDLGYHLKQVD